LKPTSIREVFIVDAICTIVLLTAEKVKDRRRTTAKRGLSCDPARAFENRLWSIGTNSLGLSVSPLESGVTAGVSRAAARAEA
jgi:hypothetical protein